MSLARVENRAEVNSTEKKVQRLFFALWPDEDLRRHIKHQSKYLLRHGGGRPLDPGNLHITLAFLGNVDANQRACAEQAASDIQCSSFKFTIDTAGYWPKPRILWLGPNEMPETLVTLATELRDGALRCGVQMDMRPYRAHITLMRKVARAPAEMAVSPFVWTAKRFVLVESITYAEGVKYEAIREWPLL